MPKQGHTRKLNLGLPEFPFALSSTSSSSNNSNGQATSFDETFDGVARLLQGRKNIVVLVGAGISVSCGIPDFRSKDAGLYNTLDIEGLGLSCAEELFCINFFRDEPGPFYSFAKNLYFPQGEDVPVEPSDSHKFLALLEQRKMLLRVYTQNIDGLENVAGVSNKKIVHVHGSLRWATCMSCSKRVSAEVIMPCIKMGSVPRCKVKRNNNHARGRSNFSGPTTRLHRSAKRPRATSDEFCGGLLKPGITFFGETLNDNVRRALEADREKIDALIVIGTSLSVAPISKVIEYMPMEIPRILINRTVVHPSTKTADSKEEMVQRENYVFDAYLLGYCDAVTRRLAKKIFGDVPQGPLPVKRTQQGGALECVLTDVLDGKEMHHDVGTWKVVSVSPDRVLLFAGAQASHGHGEGEELTYRAIAHCDGCSKQILGPIQKCIVCFDYDLCQACFPSLSATHYDGKHTFTREDSSGL